MTEPDSSPDQDRAIGRIVAVGTVVLSMIAIVIPLLDHLDVLVFWQLLLIGLAVASLVVVVTALLVGRVEGRPWSDVMRTANREVIADVKDYPARLRRAWSGFRERWRR